MTNGKQILIVDDDIDFVETLCEQLHLHEEFRSVACGSGAEALQTAKEDRFDVIILDVGNIRLPIYTHIAFVANLPTLHENLNRTRKAESLQERIDLQDF